MLVDNGAEKLRTYAEKNFSQPEVLDVAPGVWFVQNLGHSNATFIEGASGVILVDTLDTVERAEKLKAIILEKTGKAVHTFIYTHGHPDHRGGAAAFSDSVLEIIAFAPKHALLAGSDRLGDVQALRGARQFGYMLTDEEAITQGIGRREGAVYGETRGFLPVRPLYDIDEVPREIDGVTLVLRRLPGETDDTAMVWLPEQKVLCSGDNYYGCFPNLYAIRGSQYRDIASWVQSLDVLRSYEAETLLPGHTAAIFGAEKVRDVLTNYRDAIRWILDTTLEGMNAGKTADELAATIRLPERYASLPYLGEHYGCTEWTVRAIYTAYLGWFDGNPTNLHPLAPAAHAQRLIALAGGRENIRTAAAKAFADGDWQWCLELCDALMADENDRDAKLLKARAMEHLAEEETSANGRHYYLACAKDLREQAGE